MKKGLLTCVDLCGDLGLSSFTSSSDRPRSSQFERLKTLWLSERGNEIGTADITHSDSIMSLGEVVECRHYSTFLETLVKITVDAGYENAADRWVLGSASSPVSEESETL